MVNQSVGVKHDKGKLQYHLLPRRAEREVVRVLMHGAAKYSADNWRSVEPMNERYYDAARRHLDAFMSGQLLDGESGLHHLAHAVCCVLFMLESSLEAADV